MNRGKTVFAQLMNMIPEYEFDKCVEKYGGNYRVRNFSCRDHFYVMSFAQLTQRESLRDIENCLNAVPDNLYIEPAAIYVLDKGYVDFFRLFNVINKQKAYFVTRAKDNMRYEVVESYPVDQQTGVISDDLVMLTGYYTSKDYPEPFRMVTYEDFSKSVVYRFITNSQFGSLTVSELYRERWQVELFFKWIKQHLKIKSFYGTSQNAVYCQIWIALCTYLLIAIAKNRYNIEQSLYSFSQVCGITPFEKMPLNELFSRMSTIVPIDNSPNLFNFN